MEWGPVVAAFASLIGVFVFILRQFANQHFKDYNELKGKVSSLESIIKREQDEKEVEKKRANDLENEVKDIREKYIDAERRIIVASKSEELAKLNLKIAEEDNEKQARVITTMQEQIKAIQRDFAQFEETTKHDHDKLTEERDAERAKRVQVEHENGQLTKKVSELEQSIETMKKSFEAKINELAEQLSKKTDKIPEVVELVSIEKPIEGDKPSESI